MHDVLWKKQKHVLTKIQALQIHTAECRRLRHPSSKVYANRVIVYWSTIIVTKVQMAERCVDTNTSRVEEGGEEDQDCSTLCCSLLLGIALKRHPFSERSYSSDRR